ncbi:MAG: hypothetical protein KBC78_03180 [Candidatus Pacebacteria bacterium]|nr:hypothetical protein [Candidatus Paceibacterota bacterium]
MNVNSNNYKQYTFFALILIGISTFIAYIIFIAIGPQFSKLPAIIQIVISIPTVPAIYAGIFFVFDKYLWKYKFFKSIGILLADDLNGTWKGIARSSWDDFKGEIPVEFVINQTATSIKVCGKFNQSRSVSIHEYFGKNDMHNQTALYYFYKNDPNYDAPATMAMHEGSTILIYDKDTKILSGYYYSGRDRHNHGTISVARV